MVWIRAGTRRSLWFAVPTGSIAGFDCVVSGIKDDSAILTAVIAAPWSVEDLALSVAAVDRAGLLRLTDR